MSILVKDLEYVYMPGTPYETMALKGVDIEINEGEFVGLIGPTGSGKSTFIQNLNGLLKPTSGSIVIKGLTINAQSKNLKEVRKKIGLVFQYPEYQLFEETVYKDVAFGPKNLGLSKDEIDKRVRESLLIVGMDTDEIGERSPFELSGGQRRRVAIAGVIAMRPEVLILDEPAAGLDPAGRDEILGSIASMHKTYGDTIILVSHSMEEIARLVDRIIVMEDGRIVMDDIPSEIFKKADLLREMGLGVPQITRAMNALKKRGIILPDDIFTVEQAEQAILDMLKGDKNA